jgi:hypothetical protein
LTFMTDQQRQILARLIEIAGSPLLVDEAFSELSATTESFTLEDVVAYILARRDEFHTNLYEGTHSDRNHAVPV